MASASIAWAKRQLQQPNPCAWSIPSSEAASERSDRRPARRRWACGAHGAWKWSGALALNQAEVHR
jgi:hypothetical protein